MERKSSQDIAIIAVYSHPEYYPPTLNAVDEFSVRFDKVFILCRNVLESNWEYSKNVSLVKSGNLVSIREIEKYSSIRKLFSFVLYTFNFSRLLILKKPKIIQVCDVIPLFSLLLIRKLGPKNMKIWYHNHDVSDIKIIRKYSVGWFSSINEFRMFPHIDVFTLPSMDRRKYFPINELKGRFYFLPNYPSLKKFGKYFDPLKQTSNEIRLVYQGSISKGHGIEEIISVMANEICGNLLTLHLIGPISKEYEVSLLGLVKEFNVESKVKFYGFVPYRYLPLSTLNCDVGLAIYTGDDIMNSTIGTSSNKIYEYAALGLPVLLYDNDSVRRVLKGFNWVEFTDLSKLSLIKSLTNIITNYSAMQKCAIEDFKSELNFESYFNCIDCSDFVKPTELIND